MVIATAETVYGPEAALAGYLLPPSRHAEYAIVTRRAAHGRLLAAGQTPPTPMLEPPSDQVAGVPVPAVVNHGRWIVRCPVFIDDANRTTCSGAQIASRDDHRFFCVECGNPHVDGRWLPVAWPDDPDAIDAALAVRPVTYQNWEGEPVETLLADNADPVNGLV